MGRMKEAADKLLAAQTVLIFPHIHMDGDSIGSGAALAHALRSLGKEAYVLHEDKIAENLKFLDNGTCTQNQDIFENPDVCICVDCCGESRMPERYAKFMSGKELLCIDHHRTFTPFEGTAVVDPDAAAAAELIYELILEMGVTPDAKMGEALYAGITTDTGNFQYSNCTKRTHEIVTALYDTGMDHNKVSVELYENEAPNKMSLEVQIMNTITYTADSRGILAYVTQDMLKETGTSMEDTEGIVAKLRSIRGVEISAFLKEQEDGRVKVSMRAKTTANVAVICEEFEGGGHIKAAGCTLTMSVKEAAELMADRISRQLND